MVVLGIYYTVDLARLQCRRCGLEEEEMDTPFCPKLHQLGEVGGGLFDGV